MRNILITGVHKGLGKALAEEYLAAGNAVYGLSRSEPTFATAPQENFSFLAVDMSEIAHVANRVESFVAVESGFDVVILNAGILGTIQRFEKTDYETIREIMDVNVWANKELIDTLMQCTPPPKQVIAISSGSARNGSAGWGPYSVSKAALNMLIAVMANENPQTHFCTLAPGLVGTDMLNSILDAPPRPEFEADGHLRAAKEADAVQTPAEAAALMHRIETTLLTVDSGAFLDVRNLPFTG